MLRFLYGINMEIYKNKYLCKNINLGSKRVMLHLWSLRINAETDTVSVFSYELRYIVGFELVEMTISTNPKSTIYRNLDENTGPAESATIGPHIVYSVQCGFYTVTFLSDSQFDASVMEPPRGTLPIEQQVRCQVYFATWTIWSRKYFCYRRVAQGLTSHIYKVCTQAKSNSSICLLEK